MDPRDPLPHPYRAADAQCDKLTVDRRKYREINLADNGSVCRTKLAVRCDDRCIVSKLSTVQSLKQGSKVPLFLEELEFVAEQRRADRRKSRCQKSARSFDPFRQNSDLRQTDRRYSVTPSSSHHHRHHHRVARPLSFPRSSAMKDDLALDDKLNVDQG